MQINNQCKFPIFLKGLLLPTFQMRSFLILSIAFGISQAQTSNVFAQINLGGSSSAANSDHQQEADHSQTSENLNENHQCGICLTPGSKETGELYNYCSQKCPNGWSHKECIHQWRKAESAKRNQCPYCSSERNFILYDQFLAPIIKENELIRRQFVLSPVPKSREREHENITRMVLVVNYPQFFGKPSYKLYLQKPSPQKYSQSPLPEKHITDEIFLMTAKFNQKEIHFYTHSTIPKASSPLATLNFKLQPNRILYTLNEFSESESSISPILGVMLTSPQNKSSKSTETRNISLVFPKALFDEDTTQTFEKQFPEEVERDFFYPGRYQEDKPIEYFLSGTQPKVSENLYFTENRKTVVFPPPNPTVISLDFQGRSPLNSQNNIQFPTLAIEQYASDLERIKDVKNNMFQLGKVHHRSRSQVYTLDIKWPLSPIQAFGIAVSILNSKY